jgi:hypothetical protein
MLKWLEIISYVSLGGVVATLSGWRYVMWCVRKSEEKIRKYAAECEDESEKEAIIGFLEESLNKLK